MADDGVATFSKHRSLSFFEDTEAAEISGGARSSVTDLRTRLQTILDVYFLSLEVSEAADSLESLAEAFPTLRDEIVASMVRHVLDKSVSTGRRITSLLGRLKGDGTISCTAINRGFAKLMYTWEDLVLDAPKAGCALVCMVLDAIESGCLQQSFLPKMPEALLVNSLKCMDEDTDGRDEVRETIESLRAFKREVKAIGLQKKWSVEKAEKKLLRLGKPEYNFEFVRQALVCAIEGTNEDAEKCVDFLEDLCSLTALCLEDLCWGAIRLLGSLDDLELDVPGSAQKAATTLQLLVEVGLLTNGFVQRCRLLRIGGATGLQVMDSVWQATNPEAEDGSIPETKDTISPETGQNSAPSENSDQAEKDMTSTKTNSSKQDVSLRPGAGPSLRPGGGGGLSLTGGASLRPGGLTGAGSTLAPPASTATVASNEDSTQKLKNSSKDPDGGYPRSKNREKDERDKGKGRGSGYSERKTAGMEADDWRAQAAQKQQRQNDRRGGRDRRDRRGGDGKSRGAAVEAEKEAESREVKSSAPGPKLVSSENSWAAIQKRRREEAASADPDEQIIRKMKSILNKLTLEKFDELFQQLTQCGISKEKHVELLIAEVFEKATTQHHFAAMYCKLCVLMSDWCKKNNVGSLKSILLLQCQTSFEANLKPPAELVEALQKPGASEDEELQEKQLMYKRKMLGNVKLVGLLLVEKMVASKVLIACSEELMAEKSPETLEGLALLLTTTGPEFDKSEWSHHSNLRKVFDQVEKLTRDKNLPARSRFLLQDLLDLRTSMWSDQKVATKQQEGPKKLKEVAEPEVKDEGWTTAGPQKKKK